MADAADGDTIEMTAIGGAGYCVTVCVPARPSRSWTVLWIGSGSERTVTADILPSRAVTVSVTLRTSAEDDDPSDNTVTRTIAAPVS